MTAYADAGKIVTRRPAGSTAAPPPTLAPPPTATAALPIAAKPTPTQVGPRTYTVKPGDELKHIAADYNISIWTIINANDIPNPDSLQVGQVLKIPEN
jgi:LysM repeat protein